MRHSDHGAGRDESTTHPSRRNHRLLLGAGVAAGAIGVALMLVRGAARDEARVVYAPVDRVKPVADGLWVVDSGPIRPMGMALPLRMTVVRLADGGLLLHSPTRHSDELARALADIGPVRHIVAPTVAHSTFLAAWQRTCPDATLWAVPALRERAKVPQSGVRIDADLGDAAPAAWRDVMDQRLVRGGGGFEEAWFFHKASRTLILADLIENLDPAKLMPATAAVMRATFATGATTGLHVRTALIAGGAAARDAIEAMLATAPDRVLFAHGDPFTIGATERLRRAFAWLV